MNKTALTRPAPALPAGTGTYVESCSDQAFMQIFCTDGSEWTIEQLYEYYRRYIYVIAYSILNDSHLAEDVVQEVFLTLWHKASSYRQELGSLKSWLQAIVRNRATDKLRSPVCREYRLSQLQEMNGQDSARTEAELWEQVWESEQSRVLHQALAQLPSEQRQVIELQYFSGYTHTEIARQLQLPIGTVKGRIRLGIRKIKLFLQENRMVPQYE